MPISDMSPDATQSPTDAVCAAKMQKLLIRAIRTARQLVTRASALTTGCPGGKAGMNTALSTTQAEASAVLDKLTALVNAHKATGSADVTNPLL
jgi:hypothetical protein